MDKGVLVSKANTRAPSRPHPQPLSKGEGRREAKGGL
jgi:hypothetical protein